MAFGAELKDFVSGFQAGYKMLDSPEEKERKRAEEKRKQGSYDREEAWHNDNLKYRDDQVKYSREQDTIQNGRADRSEARQNKRDDWSRYDAGVQQGNREQDREDTLSERERAHKDRQDAIKLGLAKEQGTLGQQSDWIKSNNPDDTGDTPAPETAIPENNSAPSDQSSSLGNESPRYRDPMVQAANYTGAIPDASSSNGVARATNAAYGNPTTGPAIAQQMVHDLQRDFGIPQHIAVGVVGQLAGETGGFQELQEKNPTVPGSRGGGGYAQWTGPRRKQFEAFASDGGADVNSYQANYQFLRNELANTSEGGVLDKLKNAPDAKTAGRIFTDNFLRPGKPNYAGRDHWTDMVGRAVGDSQPQPRRATSAAVGGMMTAIPDDQQQQPQPDNVPVPQPRPEDHPDPQAVLPVDGPQPAPRPDYAGTSEGNKDAPTDDPYELGRRAVRDGLHQAIANTGAGDNSAIDDPELEKARQNYLRGYGAAPTQMMRQVLDTIDPDKKMAPAERNMKAMGQVYQYYNEKGDPAKAKEAAASMVQYYRQSSQQFLALAKAAAQHGDYDNAAKAAVAAYTNIPNGRDMSIKKNEDGTYAIDVTDAKTGKTVHKQVVTPEQFGAEATKFNPDTFDEEIMRAAGSTPEDFKHQTPENTEKTQTSVNDYLDTSEQADGNKLPPAVRKVVGSAALDIAGNTTNSDSSETAADFVKGMLAFNADDASDDKPNYTIAKVTGNKDYKRVTMNGETKVMSTGEVNKLEAVRKQLMADRGAGRDKKVKDDKAAAERAKLYGQFTDQFGKSVTGATTNEPQGIAVPDNNLIGGY